MGKYDGILICSDIDGTLAYESGKISSENLEAISCFMKEGGLFTISSGRSPDYIRNLHIPSNAPIIASNGAFIYDFDKGQYLSRLPISPSKLDITEKIKNKFSAEKIIIRFIYEDSWNLSYPEYDLDFLKNRAAVYKIAVHADTEQLAEEIRDYAKSVSDLSVLRGWMTGVEITETDVSKGSGLRFLKDFYKDKIKTAIAVGDFENDIPILKEADIAFAVDNAPDHIKEYADKIAPANTSHAIKHIINSL